MDDRLPFSAGRNLFVAGFYLSLTFCLSANAQNKHARQAQSAVLLDDAAPAKQDASGLDARFLTAIWHGDEASVSALLAQGADVEASNHGQTALLSASAGDQVSIVSTLLDHGANINEANPYGETPLLTAAGVGKAEIVRVLLQRGANIESRDWQGDTPLIAAANSGDLATVNLLIQNKAAVKAANKLGLTALAEAQKDSNDSWRLSPGKYAQIIAVLLSPDCARMNCISVDNPPIGTPVLPHVPWDPVLVPPSLTRCDPKASPIDGGIPYAFPADMPPLVGTAIFATINASVVAQVRLVALNNGHVVGVASEGIGEPLASYSGAGFQFKPELCVSGKWQPITNPLTIGTQGYTIGNDGQAKDDLLTMTAAGQTEQPTAGNMSLEVELSFAAPSVSATVEAKHNCHNFVLVQEATNYGSVSVHAGQTPYPAKIASVRLIYDGNYDPGDNPWHDSGQLPSPANPERLNQFPYSGALTNTVHDSSYAVVSDQNRAVGVGVGICSGFVVDDAVQLGDGRRFHGHVHSN